MEYSALEKKYYNFYAPAFKISIDGQELSSKGIEITSVSVDNTLDGADRFSFTVNNSYDIISKEVLWLDDLFKSGKSVEIRMGYTDRLKTMLMGIVTSAKVSFSPGSNPKMEVSGYDLSHKIMKGKKSRSWDEVKDSDIASKIASEYNLGTSGIESTRIKHTKLKQHNQSDFDFLNGRAKKAYFEVFVFEKVLYFRSPARNKQPVVTLEWGRNLLSFSPEIDVSQQISKVEVRGWDPAAKKEIVGTAGSGEEMGKDSSGKSGSEMSTDAYKSKVVEYLHLPVYSQQEADQMAKAILSKRAEGLVKGTGECIGIPEIIAGNCIELKGLGKKFSKCYYIKSTKHTISSSGYRTTFTVEENNI